MNHALTIIGTALLLAPLAALQAADEAAAARVPAARRLVSEGGTP